MESSKAALHASSRTRWRHHATTPLRHHATTQRKTEHTQPHVHPTRLLRQSGDGCAVKYPCILEKLWWNLWRNPWGHYFPAPPTILLNSGDDGDQDGGFDAQTTACNRRQEAWIPPKGCLCAPASQEDQAQSYMKVSQSKNKTVLSGGHQADPPVTLLLFTERYSWKMHHCHPGYLDLLPETSGNKCGTFSEFPMKPTCQKQQVLLLLDCFNKTCHTE